MKRLLCVRTRYCSHVYITHLIFSILLRGSWWFCTQRSWDLEMKDMLVIRGACDASVYLGSAQSPVSFGLYSSLDRKREKKIPTCRLQFLSYLSLFSNFMGEEEDWGRERKVGKKTLGLSLASYIPKARGGGARHDTKRPRRSGYQCDILWGSCHIPCG